MKRCKKCGVEQNNTEFHIDKKSKGGRRNTCKSCVAAYTKKHRSKHGDGIPNQNRVLNQRLVDSFKIRMGCGQRRK